MVPNTQERKPRNSSKVNLLISLTFHGIIVIGLLYFAARQGLLGKQIKKIAVEMVKEKPPEKPKEPEKPKVEMPKPEPAKIVEAPKIEAPKEVAAPPPATASGAPGVAPPAAADLSSWLSEGGRATIDSTDRVGIYKGQLEYSLRAGWERPDGLDDHAFVAEVEVAVDRTGKISDPVWKKSSGDKRWDDSVRQAITRTRGLSHAPPTNFPPRVLVRFDVIESEPLAQTLKP